MAVKRTLFFSLYCCIFPFSCFRCLFLDRSRTHTLSLSDFSLPSLPYSFSFSLSLSHTHPLSHSPRAKARACSHFFILLSYLLLLSLPCHSSHWPCLLLLLSKRFLPPPVPPLLAVLTAAAPAAVTLPFYSSLYHIYRFFND